MRDGRKSRWGRENDRFNATRYGRKNEENPDVDVPHALLILRNPIGFEKRRKGDLLIVSILKSLPGLFSNRPLISRNPNRISIIFKILISVKPILFSYRG
jgi:hypothetical protein